MTNHAVARRQRLAGIALMCTAVACLTFVDALSKYLVGYMEPLQVVWARYTSAFVLAFVVSNPLTRPGMLVTRRPLLQLSRSIFMVGGTFLNVLALRYLQIDQTLSIVFSTPFLVAAMAGPLLGEWIGWRRWIAITVGFVGVLVVIRPGFDMHPAALLSVATAVCYAFYGIITRLLSHTDSNETQLFYGNFVGAVAMCCVVWFVWTTPESLWLVALMVFIGGFGSVGHYLLIAAHRLAPASLISPFMYTQLVWGITLGYLIFQDVPSSWTLAGASIVVGSGLYLVNRERKRHSTEAARATSDTAGPH
ncbi:MAG: EamA family transporter [Rhizobiales bacterium]|nr:EamA family transporter [Hyphomicrobiales bacterium]